MMNFQKSKCLFKNGFPEEENAVFMYMYKAYQIIRCG